MTRSEANEAYAMAQNLIEEFIADAMEELRQDDSLDVSEAELAALAQKWRIDGMIRMASYIESRVDEETLH